MRRRCRPRAAPRAAARAALEEQKRSFLRLVSHELRTPLNSIIGFSEILASELYGPLGAPQYQEYAEIIRGSGKKLLKLVNQVLEIARLEGHAPTSTSGPEPLEPAFDDVLARPARGPRPRACASRVDRRTAPCPRCWPTPGACAPCSTNLLQNAITFSPDGGEVARCAPRSRRRSTIVVEDDGEGVDPAELPG